MPSPTEPGLPARIRWREEGERHARAGDYAWMAAPLAGERVLEVGCGDGFGTLALLGAGCPVMVVEIDDACREAAARRVAAVAGPAPAWWAGDVRSPDPAMRAAIREFAPTTIACWMIGVDEATADPAIPPHEAVRLAREAVHRAVAELAAGLPSVRLVHLVDRTAFPWKIKDTARETLVLLHSARTFAGMPFSCRREDALYRKLDPRVWPDGMRRGNAAGIVPVLGSMLARRNLDRVPHGAGET